MLEFFFNQRKKLNCKYFMIFIFEKFSFFFFEGSTDCAMSEIYNFHQEKVINKWDTPQSLINFLMLENTQ
jgi:hypothetical protein